MKKPANIAKQNHPSRLLSPHLSGRCCCCTAFGEYGLHYFSSSKGTLWTFLLPVVSHSGLCSPAPAHSSMCLTKAGTRSPQTLRIHFHRN